MKNKKTLLIALLIIFKLQISTAQQVETQNKTEYYKEDTEVEDMNIISLSKKEKIKEAITMEDLERILNKRRNKRYRKVRKNIDKCFYTEEKKDCHQ